MKINKINIINSDIKNINIFYMDYNEKRGNEFEALSEHDFELARLNIYSFHNLNDVIEVSKNTSPNLIIFINGFENLNFTILQSELTRLFPNVDLLPIVNAPTVAEIRQSRNISKILDFTSENDIRDFNSFKNLILTSIRLANKTSNLSENLKNYIMPISSSLLVGNQNWKSIKINSECILFKILNLYDISEFEALNIWAAEKIYFPWVSFESYKTILEANSEILKIINDSLINLNNENQKPRSLASFLIRFVNSVSEQHYNGKTFEEIEEYIKSRPIELKFQAIKTLEVYGIKNICENAIKKYA